MSVGKRAWEQFIESAFVTGCLIAALEVALPAIERQAMDWNQLSLICAFGIFVILGHTAVAFLRRPPEHDKKTERIEQRLAALEQRWQPQGPGPPATIRYAQLQQWAQNDPTWAPTTPDLPAIPRTRPPPTQRRPGM